MKKLLLLAAVVSLSSFTFASVVTIDFEQYPAYTQITNQYAASDGAVFTNALQLVVPFYDYFDYPPHSGSGVITNDPADPIQVNFTNSLVTVHSVSGWYTGPNGVVLSLYRANGSLIASYSEPAIYGATSNFSATSASPIGYITVADATGSSDNITVDDLSFTTTPVPESGSLTLMGSALIGVAGLLRQKLER